MQSVFKNFIGGLNYDWSNPFINRIHVIPISGGLGGQAIPKKTLEERRITTLKGRQKLLKIFLWIKIWRPIQHLAFILCSLSSSREGGEKFCLWRTKIKYFLYLDCHYKFLFKLNTWSKSKKLGSQALLMCHTLWCFVAISHKNKCVLA